MPYHRPIPEENPRGKPSGLFSAYIEAERLIQIALILPCAVVVGWLVGAWLDTRLHQSWIALVGILVGGIAGLTGAVRIALAAGADPKLENQSGNGTERGNSSKRDDTRSSSNP
jgi:F0F1-type ATP synthase assembly protein I